MLKIAITGHRRLVVDNALIHGIDQSLHIIQDAFPGLSWRLLSGLAEGADRLVLERALLCQPDLSLCAALPLPAADYLTDFDSHETLAAFNRSIDRAEQVVVMPPQTSRQEAYRAAGEYLVHHSDLLLAVWDGQPAVGVGGTGEVVDLARRYGLTFVWVQANNWNHERHEWYKRSLEQGKVRVENFPPRKPV